jgi:hypothetical protein
MKNIGLFIVVLLSMVSCDSSETSRDALVELKRIDYGDKSMVFYQYASEAENLNTAMILVADKDEKIDFRNQAYFSNIDLDTIYWQNKDTIIAAEKFINYVVRGKSNYKDSVYFINGVTIRIVRMDPVDSTSVRESLLKQLSPDNSQELYVFRYTHPLGKYSILNVSIIPVGTSLSKYGNFYVGKSDFDCIRDVRWDSIGDFSISASPNCYYGFDEYLNKNRPSVKYKLSLSNDALNPLFTQSAIVYIDSNSVEIDSLETNTSNQ